MSQTAPTPEPLEYKASRWLNISMVWFLSLAIFAAFAWGAASRWSVVIPTLRGDPGTNANDLTPWSLGLMTIANLTLWSSGRGAAKRGLARWMSRISSAVGFFASFLLWAGWGWLLFGTWALAAAGLRPWPQPNTGHAWVMILFGLVTVVAMAAIIMRIVARKPSSPA